MKRTYLFGTMMAFGLAVASVGVAGPSGSVVQRSAGQERCGDGVPQERSAADWQRRIRDRRHDRHVGYHCKWCSSFILADAKVAGKTGTDSATAATGSTAGTTGTSGTTASADKDKAKSFALVGGTPSELQGYLNSKVEITGTIDPSASASSATTTAPAPSATGTATTPATGSMAGMAHAADQAKLRVTSVRQVAATCDAGQQ